MKPFSARELVARVRVQVEIARARDRERLHGSARMAQEQLRKVAESTSHVRDEFLAILGHELRNPLAPILTALELMKMRGEESSLRERAIIERQVTHVVRLVDDLLDVSKITRGKVDLDKRPIEIGAVIAAAIETVSPLLEQRQHRLVTEVSPHLTKLDADPFRLNQIVANLLTNAAKYTPAGGTITVSANTEAGIMVIRVKDTGVGIHADLLPRVFDAFTQSAQASDRAQGGLGLGLAIVKSLVTMHGGQVEANSAGSGKGSEFIVRLPITHATVAASVQLAPSPAPASPPPRSLGLRVLVVE